MGEFRMPALGAEMTEGRLDQWLVKPGDTVHRGDLIAVVETDKAAIEVEVWQDGTVEELLVEEGTKVPVGTPLAVLGDGVVEREAGPSEASEVEEPAAELEVREPGIGIREIEREVAAVPSVRGPLARHRADELGVDLAAVHGTGPGGAITRHDVEAAGRTVTGRAPSPEREGGARPRVSPYARRLAAEQGVDVATVTGSGPGGAIVARDLEGRPAAPGDAKEAETVVGAPRTATSEERREGAATEREGQSTMRLAIARAMARANREIPHYYLGTVVDITDTQKWLTTHNEGRPPAERVLLAAVQLKAVALALRDHPELNGFWIDDEFRPAESIDIGVAIALRGGGLIAPAIEGTDTLDLDELMARLRDLVRRTRSGRLRGAEATSATITVTNLGDLGVESVYGVITPPQVALVGFGRPVERPWAVDGMLGVREVVHLTLAADHRQTDGAVGARFLSDVELLLRRPEEL